MLPAPPTATDLQGRYFRKIAVSNIVITRLKIDFFDYLLNQFEMDCVGFTVINFVNFICFENLSKRAAKKYEQHAVNQLEMSSSIAATRIPMSNTGEQRIRLYNPATRNKSIWKRSAFPRVSFLCEHFSDSIFREKLFLKIATARRNVESGQQKRIR
jgi:hypothetical protein